MGLGSNQVVTGIDVGSSSVKVVRLAHRRSSSEVVGVALSEIPQGSSDETDILDARKRVVAAINQALSSTGVDPGRAGTVVTSVSGPSVSVKHVAFPEMSDKELAESVRWEAKKHLPFDTDNVDLDYQKLGREDIEKNDERTQVLLGAAQSGVLVDHLDALADAGIEPTIVDLTPTALINEVDEEGLVNGQAVAVADLGHRSASLSVYTRGGLFFARSIPIVPRQENWLEHVLTEVRFSLTFYNNETGRKGIESLYVAGGRSLESGVIGRFADALGVPTELLDPLASVGAFELEGELAAQSPRFALAMGLARRR